MKYTRESIIERYNAGEEMNIIAFWGHTPNPKKTTKACFSQWFDCRFEVDGVLYHTTEQYMMSQKAVLMGDAVTCEKIMASDNPRDYKALGREVQHFDAELWNDIYNDDSAERDFNHHIYGSDASFYAIQQAAKNVKSAGVQKDIDLRQIRMEEIKMVNDQINDQMVND